MALAEMPHADLVELKQQFLALPETEREKYYEAARLKRPNENWRTVSVEGKLHRALLEFVA